MREGVPKASSFQVSRVIQDQFDNFKNAVEFVLGLDKKWLYSAICGLDRQVAEEQEEVEAISVCLYEVCKTKELWKRNVFANAFNQQWARSKQA